MVRSSTVNNKESITPQVPCVCLRYSRDPELRISGDQAWYELFPESPDPAPGSPARSESSMASSTNSAHIERDVPSPPRVVQGVVHVMHDGGETTTMTQALSTAYKYAVA